MNDPHEQGSAPRSGLKNPRRAIGGVAAATLAFEGLVVLFALRPIALVGAGLSAPRLAVLLALVALLFATAGLLRFRWAYVLGTVLQLLVVASGVLTYAMYFLGAVFLGIWCYVLWLRRMMGVR